MAKLRQSFDRKQRAAGIRHGWRSGLEEKVGRELSEQGVPYSFESLKIEYIEPAKKRRYTPDFILTKKDGTSMIIETKGRYTASDRKKHLLIKEQYPNLDLRFVFSNSRTKLYKGSKTRYCDWCDKHGFLYADKSIPKEWLEE